MTIAIFQLNPLNKSPAPDDDDRMNKGAKIITTQLRVGGSSQIYTATSNFSPPHPALAAT
jgi:hypothetical protein